jgi:hypothetical protein
MHSEEGNPFFYNPKEYYSIITFISLVISVEFIVC